MPDSYLTNRECFFFHTPKNTLNHMLLLLFLAGGGVIDHLFFPFRLLIQESRNINTVQCP